MILNTQYVPDLKTLLIALAGAIIGQSLSWLITWRKKSIDLNNKTKMIIQDIEKQSDRLDQVKEMHLELKHRFETKRIDTFTTYTFQNIDLDIYKSVPKNELYQIFKENLNDLVEAYNSIEFLKKNGPHYVYMDYVRKIDAHTIEKKGVKDHKEYCGTHLRFIDLAIRNIDNHVNSINKVKEKINKIKLKHEDRGLKKRIYKIFF